MCEPQNRTLRPEESDGGLNPNAAIELADLAHVVLDVNLWDEAKRTNFLLRSAVCSRRGRREPLRKRFSERFSISFTAIAAFGINNPSRLFRD